MKKSKSLLVALIALSTAQAQSWSLTGNAGTNPAVNFLGTRDNRPLRIRINNQYAGEIDSASTKTFLGYGAGKSVTTGTNNAAVGFKSFFSNTIGSYNAALGAYALYANTGYYNGAVGYAALYSNSTGAYNNAFGHTALYSNTTGGGNNAVGDAALYSNTAGTNNSALGLWTLYSNTTGSFNDGFGTDALYYNTTGSGNTAMGSYSLNLNTSGNYNTAVGYTALYYNNGGHYNTAVGGLALYRTTNSWYNTVVGYNSGRLYDMGYNNTILGANCDGSFAGQYNIIAIGQGVTCPDNSTARIGNAATWSIGGYAGWSNFSDGRYKKDIKEDVIGLDFIMKLRPITYRLDISGLSKQLKENQGEEWSKQMKTAISEKEKMIYTGFVAQEVEKAASEAGYEFSGVDKPRNGNGFYALRYAEFVVPLVKAVQEQQKIISDLQKRVDVLEQQADISVQLRESQPNEKITAYPNPVNNNMVVTINTQAVGRGLLQLFDSGGRLMKQMPIDLQKGINTINLSLPALAAGYYDLKLDWGKEMHKHVSIVKQ